MMIGIDIVPSKLINRLFVYMTSQSRKHKGGLATATWPPNG